MSIDPKVAMILNIICLVLSVAASASWWGDLLGSHTAGMIQGILGTIVTAGNVVLHAYSSNVPGPAAK